MSVDRLPALTPQPPATAQAPRDIRAAQRAFFQAAVSAAPAPAAMAAPAQATPVQATPAAPPAADPDRPLRPGSFIDIRV